MQSFIFLFLLPILLASCTNPPAYSKKNAQIEIIVQKIQSDVEALKHDIRCQNMELRMIEGKLVNAQETLTLFKNELMKNCQNSLVTIQDYIKELQTNSTNLTKQQISMKEGIEHLQSKANTLSKSLDIYKSKVQNIETQYLQTAPFPRGEKKSPS